MGAWRTRVLSGIAWGALLVFQTCPNVGVAQQLEPRRWAHLPIDTNFFGVAYLYNGEEIAFDPALRLDDVESSGNSFGLKYIRTVDCLGKSARVEVMPVYNYVRWEGLLDGQPRSVKRSGIADPVVRFAVSLWGAPPLAKEEFVRYRAQADSETIVGAALAVHLPFGHYLEDKLLNIGGNRFIFRPQIGIVHELEDWSIEFTGESWIYTENDEFFGRSSREQDPYYVVQSQVVYDLRPSVWIAVSGGYGNGASSTINGEDKDDQRQDLAWALTFGFPVTKSIGAKLAYIRSDSQESVGSDSDTLALALLTQW